MGTAEPIPNHAWNDDRAGERPQDDLLERDGFAQLLARQIRAWRRKQCLVLSLNGDWGSGKTTLANLILHHLQQQADCAGEQPVLAVRFNPWQWSGQDLVLEAFFEEIGTQLGRGDSDGRDKRLGATWKRLGAASSLGRVAVQWLRRAFTAGASVAAASGEATLATVSTAAAVGASEVEAALIGVRDVSEAAASGHASGPAAVDASLNEVRAELHSLLKERDAPVLILIDDLDRLTKEQVRMLLQLVKANTDLPNTIYLLLYQKSLVSRALDEVACEEGSRFLQKIVQIELEVPAAPDHALRKMLQSQIEPLLTRAPWDQRRWGELFEDGVWPYFRTPRDIKRFRNTLEFYIAAHSAEGVLEVNLVDLVLIELLRTFDAPAYEAVRGAFLRLRDDLVATLYGDKELKAVFVGVTKTLLERKSLSEREKQALRALLTCISHR